MNGFRSSVLESGSGAFAIGGGNDHIGIAPAPFDDADGARLAGPPGSHPLAAVSIEDMLSDRSKGLDGVIEIKHPVQIGEAIEGHIRVTALRDIKARGARLRLVGAAIAEQRQSQEESDSQGKVSREEWVEVRGTLFEELPFAQPALPSQLSSGQTFEADFTIPSPRHGPPSGHYGTAIIGWAVEAHWDIAMGSDERLAALVKLDPGVDYLRSGAVRLGDGALEDQWQVGDGSIAVAPVPPAVSGSEIDVTVVWPSAGGGRSARIELQADIEGPNGMSDVVLWSTQLAPDAFRAGATVRVPIPADAPPTVSSQGIGVGYRIRALVDRQFRSDLAIERAIAVL